MSQFRMLIFHCRRMFLVAGLLMLCGLVWAPDAVGGRFWTGSAWMLLSPLILLTRYARDEFKHRAQSVLFSPRRSQIHLIELNVSFGLCLLLGIVCVGGVTWPALVLGLWGSFLCGLASVLEQSNGLLRMP